MSTKEQLARAIHTASLWHSDQAGNGLALLSLSSTRTVHSEEHRCNLLKETDQSLQYTETELNKQVMGDKMNVDVAKELVKDLDQLLDLRKLIQTATIKQEWLTDQENMRINEQLYQAGKL